MPIKDKSLYPDNWDEIRESILERASHQCEKCGISNYAIRDGSKVVLTIAHWYDKNPSNVSRDNLRALCQKCHNSIDAYDRQKTRKITKLERLLEQALPYLETSLKDLNNKRDSINIIYGASAHQERLANDLKELKSIVKTIKREINQDA